MTTANQTTGTDGRRLLSGFDLSGLRGAEIGSRIDPFTAINWEEEKDHNGPPRTVGLLMSQDKMARVSKLAYHLYKDGILIQTPARLFKHNGSYMIIAGGYSYIIYGGLIYTKKGSYI